MLTIGHRGAPNLAQENTIDSFDKAFKSGVDGIELDVQLTQDNQLAVFHDFDTFSLNGRNDLIKDISYTHLQSLSAKFKIPKLGFIAGCKVINGKIIRNGKARLVRDGKLFREGLINSLKRHKDDAKEVKDGLECGIGVEGVKKFTEGDIIEVYEIKEVKRKLELT